MNKAISWKTDEHFSEGNEYLCSDAYARYETAMVSMTDDNGEIIEVDINDKDFDFVFDHNKE